jgi:DNA-binding PadR family transcriptional regulator
VTHGYALIARLNELGVTADGIDVGMTYRALRELEAGGAVDSMWSADEHAPRRAYRLTPLGHETLREWVTVMEERGRLIGELVPRYERLTTGEGG